MSRTFHSKREDLICGKIDKAIYSIQNGDLVDAIDIMGNIRYDAERMEQKLISRKSEAITFKQEIEDNNTGYTKAIDFLINELKDLVKYSYLSSDGKQVINTGRINMERIIQLITF